MSLVGPWVGGNEKGADLAVDPILFRIRGEPDQRFENWKLRRALARPCFLRSTTRGSRVRKAGGLDRTAQHGLELGERLRNAVLDRSRPGQRDRRP